ncbi:hypothetical protein IWX46DRAFT_594062 [Phyllosticta citricarpa]|uniref:Secreted protein n=1 Tax=Phyllosticta citricarpa TaxID=55181 RepID=A0ABR1MJ62_9PEZI
MYAQIALVTFAHPILLCAPEFGAESLSLEAGSVRPCSLLDSNEKWATSERRDWRCRVAVHGRKICAVSIRRLGHCVEKMTSRLLAARP